MDNNYQKLIDEAFYFNYLVDINKAVNTFAIIMITDRHGTILEVNQKMEDISGYDKEELIGANPRILNSGYHSGEFFTDLWETVLNGETWSGEVCNRTKSGELVWERTLIVPIEDQEGDVDKLVTLRHDITDRVHAEKKLQEAIKQDFRRIAKNLQNGVFLLSENSEGELIFSMAEGEVMQKHRLATEKVSGKKLINLFPEEIFRLFYHNYMEVLEKDKLSFEISIEGSDYLIQLSAIRSAAEETEVAGSVMDITELKKQKEIISHLAYFDELTKLPNRKQFKKNIDRMLSQPNAENESIGVFLLNISGIKSINETLGHDVGNRLITSIAERINENIKEDAELSRFSDYNFAIHKSCKNMTKEEVLIEVKRLQAALHEPFEMGDMLLHIRANIGISIGSHQEKDFETLIKEAEASVNFAKSSVYGNVYMFDQELEKSLHRNLAIENDLRGAIQRRELKLFVQPKINAVTGIICGGEVLLRWYHPHMGWIPPDEFIPVAERSNVIQSIGKWVLEEALKLLAEWHDLGLTALAVSVNVSIRQFLNHQFANEVASLIETHGVPANKLELEITENAFGDTAMTREMMMELKKLGCILSLDDFGTGYSSMKYLQELSFDRIKIDKSFVINLNEDNIKIIKATIHLAKALNLTTVAEGVETEEHAKTLRTLKAGELQGYYFDKPIAKEAFNRKWILPATEES